MNSEYVSISEYRLWDSNPSVSSIMKPVLLLKEDFMNEGIYPNTGYGIRTHHVIHHETCTTIIIMILKEVFL